jgi:hypothetical protein
MITVSYNFTLTGGLVNDDAVNPAQIIPMADGRLIALYHGGSVYSQTYVFFPNGGWGGQLIFNHGGNPELFGPVGGVGLAGGGAVLYDASFTSSPSTQLAFQRIDATGSALAGGPIAVASITGSTFNDVEFDALADGGFVATWGTGGSTDLHAAIYNADGSVRRAAYNIAGFGEALPLLGGGFMLLHPNGGGGTLADRYDANGNFLGNTTFAASYNEIMELDDGGFAFLLTNGALQIFNADGSARTAEVGAGTFADLLGALEGEIAVELVANNRFAVYDADTGAQLSLGPVAGNGASPSTWHGIAGPNFAYLTIDEFRAHGPRIYQYARTSTSDAAGDVITGVAYNESMFGNGGDDTLLGLAGDDALDGGTGADSLDGGAGMDSLLGGSEADTLAGGEGNDTLDGGAGADAMDGGAGDDLIVYDAADNFANVLGGSGYDFLFINDAGVLPTNLTVGANGIEQVNALYIDHSAQSWSTITVYADGAWNILARTILNDDNTVVTTYYDHNSTQPWSSYDENYNQYAQLVYTRTYADGGDYETQFFDIGGNPPWTSYIDYSNAVNVLLSRRTFLDTGRLETIYYDYANNQSYSQYIDFANASGQVDARRAVLDNGRLETTYLDVASAQSWSEYTDYATASGAVDARRVVYDNAHYSYTYYDIDGSDSYAYYTDLFDSLGNFVSRSGQNDDGSFF